ncbi:hypothetical protein L2E82_12265 [Cichorium intybus]|uniref:Uncharacterized protein n=1 Tax=Cichorium intybus TaxID=13427 RepID=A0ACB9GFG6_CICIN|nr:hypothetical protein L2E82_12265 [Cichorium intybus]
MSSVGAVVAITVVVSGFGTVYKGIFSNGTAVAVKVLNGTSDSIEEQFMAEVSTMGRTHHFNLVRLYGFCFESSLRALVYEFMVNSSLDNHLFKANKGPIIGFEKLYEIALGTARGIAYLHEECPQRIVHYDIKPGNILLDSNFCAKVADFGLAKLCNRDNTHITMTKGRGTPGYAAPEVWLPLPVSHKCDVYSFGMLLFEIIGRRRNDMDVGLGDIQQWFPIWVWGKYEKKELKDLMDVCAIEEKDHQAVERMLKVALCCVQYRPETRPVMSIVVKMLESALPVPESLNPFSYLFSGVNEADDSLARLAWNGGGTDWSSSDVITKSTVVAGGKIEAGRKELGRAIHRHHYNVSPLHHQQITTLHRHSTISTKNKFDGRFVLRSTEQILQIYRPSPLVLLLTGRGVVRQIGGGIGV